ncbi:MAG: Rieske 2Fe-2S domain-containing protein [Bryobacterales bacterium]|nr:Rieske 2Fe-2S domain-containing protein [Bryobacterales bacterium]
MKRRNFLLSPMLLAALPPRCCDLPEAPAGSFQVSGGVLTLRMKELPQALRISDEARKLKVILVRTADGKLAAVSGVCTHGGAPLVMNERHGTVICTSLGHSEFDLRGKVLRGPAPKPIQVYAVRETGGAVEIVL